MAQHIQIANGTASQWSSVNPTLLAGEIGFESDSYKFKIGTGSTSWNSLGYFSGGGGGGGGTWGSIVGLLSDQIDLSSTLALLAPLASPALSGSPTATTASGGDNSTRIATTAFVTTAIASAVTGLLDLKTATDASSNPNYPAASKGDAYFVSVAGKIGGASGKSVDVSDMYLAVADNAGGTEGAVGTSWIVLEHNLVGAALTSGTLAQFAATTSAQLAGVISDETGFGSGALLVFNKGPTFSADPMTVPGSIICAPAAMTTAIDFLRGENDLTLTGNVTLTVSGSPATGQQTLMKVIGDTVDRTVTLPAGTWKGLVAQATITSFVAPANKTFYVPIVKTAAGYDIVEPAAIADKSWTQRVATGANGSIILDLSAAQARTIKSIKALRTGANTFDVKGQIGGVDVTGLALTGVGGTLASANATANNVMAVGDQFTLVLANAATATGLVIEVIWTPTSL